MEGRREGEANSDSGDRYRQMGRHELGAGGEVAHFTCIDEARRDNEIGFYRDGGHLSRTSGIEHLVGYGYFAMLYRRSPATVEGYAPPKVPPAFDKQMREAIWKAVVASPFSEIDDADGDGIADR